MYVCYYFEKTLILLKSKTMETNWIILTIVLVCVILLIIYLVIRDQKDKNEVTASMNNEDDIESELETEKDKETNEEIE